LALTTVVSGCVTLGRFEELEQRVNALERDHVALRERTDVHETRLENLNSILKRSEADLREGFAATSSTVDEIDERLRRTMGSLESSQFQMERDSRLIKRIADLLDAKYGTTLAALPDNLPTEPEALYKAGVDRLNAGNWKEARAVFREYLSRNPSGANAADAQFGVGESLFGEKDYERAIGEFKAVFAAYKESPRAGDALLRIGDALVAQQQCAKAKQVYELVVREVAKSPAAAKAKELLKTLGSRCK
jgi:tol-pal system protein YbgF